jgi:hypothetical protein
MGRALAAVGALLIVCFGVLGGVVWLTRSEDRLAVDAVLAERLTKAVAESEARGEPVDLDRLTAFHWDEVLVFAPKTPVSRISRELGYEFKGDLNYTAESGELFVFLAGGALRRFADYRGLGRFEGLERPVARLTPATAVFEVRDLVARRP